MSIFLALIAAFSTAILWGGGDFYIQKSTRKVGDWETLFVITGFGALALLPFSWRGLLVLLDGSHNSDILILVGSGLFLCLAAILILQAMKVGKLSVIEPIYPLEIIAAGLISFFVLREQLSIVQICLIGALIICFILLSIREHGTVKLHRFFLERGVLFVIAGSILMGIADVLLGWGTRVTDPFLSNFVVNVIIALISFSYLLYHKKVGKLFDDVKSFPTIFILMSVFDNAAWVLYAYAMSMAPIAIVTSITESSIIVAVILGIFFNKEKLQHHQKIAVVGAIACGIGLGIFAN